MTTFDDLAHRVAALEHLLEHGPESWMRGAMWVSDVTERLGRIEDTLSGHTEQLGRIEETLTEHTGILRDLVSAVERLAGLAGPPSGGPSAVPPAV